MSRLAEFRQGLQSLMTTPKERPFVCDGNPLEAKVFIVGFNPATKLEKDFWSYWTDNDGYDRSKFMEDYLKMRKLKGVRPRIQLIVNQLAKSACIETNICAVPTKSASELCHSDRRTASFEYLFDNIKPEVVFLHSNEPITYFKMKTGCRDIAGTFVEAKWNGHRFRILANSGPLWRVSYQNAQLIGRQLANAL